jgi:outer membrane receptor protein involved in Fe transport
MPASSIEKIEVISNPSAKFKPDGTSGIINIVQKKNTTLGINGNLTANAGNQGRYNGNVRLNYNPGNLNMYASYSLRKDNRNRTSSDARIQTDSTSVVTYYNGDLFSYASPLSNTAALGLDYRINSENQFGISGNYFINTFTRTDNLNTLLQDETRVATESYVRNRFDPEYEKEYGFATYIEHDFPKDEHKLRLEFSSSQSPEQEDNHYSNIYQLPSASTTYDNTLIKQSGKENQISLDYSNPLSEKSSLEVGYAGEFKNNDFDFYAEYFDASQQRFVKDGAKTNQFLFDESINALYVTYKQSFGAFGIMGGLRTEQANRTSDLLTSSSIFSDSYFHIYPSVHLSYKLNSAAELQLSYSRRTNRPRGEDLNPFPEYRDPRNVSAGNPSLLPEYIHSVELGCQFQNDLISILPAIYYRYTDNRFTQLTQAINDSTLLTTRYNLSNDQSGGLELIVSANFGEIITAHWNASGFYNQIDASNLGYSDKKSITTWSSALTFNVNVAKGSRVQINSNYNSSRLTPQGENSPSYVVNTGFRQELFDGNLSLVLTATDIFKTAKRRLELNTPLLNQTVINRRDSRIVYFGFTYHFGAPTKKSKEDQLRYDDN